MNIKQFQGMNTVRNKLSPEVCSEQQDMVSQRGQVKTRGGFAKFNPLAFSGGILGLFDYKCKNGLRYMLAFDNTGNAYKTVRASFTAVPIYGEKSLTAYFVDTTEDLDSEITSYSWEFGDGGTSTDQNPVHTYTKTGVFTATFTVSDGTRSYSAAKRLYVFVYDSGEPYGSYPWGYPPWDYDAPYNPDPDEKNENYKGWKDWEDPTHLDVTAVSPVEMVEGETPTLTLTGVGFDENKIRYVILANSSGIYKFASANVTVNSKTELEAVVS